MTILTILPLLQLPIGIILAVALIWNIFYRKYKLRKTLKELEQKWKQLK